MSRPKPPHEPMMMKTDKKHPEKSYTYLYLSHIPMIYPSLLSLGPPLKTLEIFIIFLGLRTNIERFIRKLLKNVLNLC